MGRRLDNGPDSIVVTPSVNKTTERGNEVRVPGPDSAPLPKVWMFPLDSELVTTHGQRVASRYKLVCRSFPGAAWSMVTFKGRDFDVIDEPLRYTGSPRVAHDVVMLKARSPEAVPDG